MVILKSAVAWGLCLVLAVLFELGGGQAPRQFDRFPEYNEVEVPDDVLAGIRGGAREGVEVGVVSRRVQRCYICSGQFPDRECELYPQYVTQGPGMINCSRAFCTTYVRYRPKPYLLTPSGDGELKGTSRPLVPEDFEVNSIARECEDLNRGNTCAVDHDGLGLTCYTTCASDLCNDELREPVAEDFSNTLQASDPTALPSTPLTLTLDNNLNAVPVDGLGPNDIDGLGFPLDGAAYNSTIADSKDGAFPPRDGEKGADPDAKEKDIQGDGKNTPPRGKTPRRKGDRPSNVNSQTNTGDHQGALASILCVCAVLSLASQLH